MNLKERYQRQVKLWGEEGQGKISKASVLVAGVGGLGSTAAMQLAAIGVGKLRIADRDIVDLANLHRQPLYTERDVDRSKVEVAKERLEEINPSIKVEAVPLFIGEDNARGVVRGVDVVVDGLDNFQPRYALNRACIKKKIPFVFAGALKSWANISTFAPGKGPCLECVFSGLDGAEMVTCETAGVHPSIMGLAANIQVHQTTQLLVGEKPSLEGKILYVNLNSMDFELVDISRNKECPACSPKPKKLVQMFPSEICGGGFMFKIGKPPEDFQLKNLLKKSEFSITFKYNGAKVSVIAGGAALIRGVDRGTAEKIAKKLFR